jgi:hypothetical protein
MRLAIAFAMLSALPGAVGAGCNYDLVGVTAWTITPIDERTNRLVTRMEWVGPEAVRMVDGSVQFRDVLGASIAAFGLTRDQTLTPGAGFEETGRWGPHTFERLLEMNPEDVIVKVCIRGLVSESGRVERF